MKTAVGSCLTVLAILAAAPASASERWVHVRVDDSGDAKARVDIQVPVELVSALLPALKDMQGSHAIKVDSANISMEQLRGYWDAVRDAKDGEYVKLHDADSDVRIAKSGGTLRVVVNDNGGGSRVRMTVPLPLVDAVLSSGGTIDLDSIGGALRKIPPGDLLTVDDEDSHVRIWIDSQAAAAREDVR